MSREILIDLDDELYRKLEKQFKEFGVEFVQNNRAYFEELAYAEENEFIEKLKKAGKL